MLTLLPPRRPPIAAGAATALIVGLGGFAAGVVTGLAIDGPERGEFRHGGFGDRDGFEGRGGPFGHRGEGDFGAEQPGLPQPPPPAPPGQPEQPAQPAQPAQPGQPPLGGNGDSQNGDSQNGDSQRD